MCLHHLLYLIGQRWEEINACYSLHLINRVGIVALWSVAVGILVDKSNGLRLTLHLEHHLEESVWHSHFVLAYGLGALLVEYRTANYVNLAIFLCPFTTDLSTYYSRHG